ncbi:P-type conjugative transfer protein TrbL, partial [Aromatoleum aromaticum]
MRYLVLRLMLMMSMLLLSGAASAAIEPSGVLDQVADRFLTESAAWASKITEYATWLFWTLVVISMVWTFGMMALRKADIGEFFAELVKFTIFTGFFWWLLLNGPGFAMSIIDSLRNIGSVAAGISRDLTPSRPIDIAFDILVKAGKSYTVLSPIDNLSIFFTTLAILACMGVVAANVLLALVNAWVLVYAGIFVLGFGGSRWTSDIAINYFRAVTGIALKLMTMTLLIGVAVSVMDGYHADLQEGAPLRELLVIFVVALVLAVLIHSIPNMIAGLIPGGGHAASSGSSFSAGAVGGAALGAGAALASGGAALVAG